MIKLNINIPQGFYEEEIRDGYLVSHDIKQLWAVLLDLLNEFMRVCQKHDIKWYADAGTILGAVRHKGMIPWDDDIDVMMLREEYDRFMTIARHDFKYPYFLQSEEYDKGSFRGHAQLRNSLTTGILTSEKNFKCPYNQGIFLDIFPIDNIPDNELELKEYTEKINEIRSTIYYKRHYFWGHKFTLDNGLYRNLKDICKYAFYKSRYMIKGTIGYEKHYREYEELIRKYKGINTTHVCKLALTPFKPRRLWLREWFDDTIYLPFEMFYIPVPKGYINLLDTFYGNWHEFVIGACTHSGIIYDVDTPYTIYKQ